MSYSRDDLKATNEFLESLKRQLKPAKKYCFSFFKDDENILVGQNWRQEIEEALNKCDVGLLLVSPSFIGSDFVVKTELASFAISNKVLIPILLDDVSPEHDMKGLDEKQIFRLGVDRDGRAFVNCDEQQRRNFVKTLFEKMVERLRKLD